MDINIATGHIFDQGIFRENLSCCKPFEGNTYDEFEIGKVVRIRPGIDDFAERKYSQWTYSILRRGFLRIMASGYILGTREFV